MRILHTYCLNYNLGDHALGYGQKKALRELLNVDFIAETNLQGQHFDEYFIDVVNKRFDLLVLGGGGIIHGAHWPNGWFWLIPEELIGALRIPFIVYAAGYNYFKDEDGIPPHGVSHLKTTAKHSRLFSVRNDGSHDRLFDDTGIKADVIADPGFWVSKDETFPLPSVPDKNYVLIQLADDKPEHRFGSMDERARVVEELRAQVSRLSTEYHVVLAPHVHDDIKISREVIDGIENASIWPFSDFAFDRVERIFGYYEHAKCVVAMRGHGQIVPLSFGVPTISLENHDKHRELMRGLDLTEYNVNISEPGELACLYPLVIEAIAKRPMLHAHMRSVLDGLWNMTKTVFRNTDLMK